MYKALGLPPGDPALATWSNIRWMWAAAQVDEDDRERRKEFEVYFWSALAVLEPERAEILKREWDTLAEMTPDDRKRRIREISERTMTLRQMGGAGRDDETAAMLKARASITRPNPTGDQLDIIETAEDLMEQPEE